MHNQPIGDRVLRNFNFLKACARTRNADKRDKLLSNASGDELLSLVECAFNLLNSNFTLKPRQKRKLYPHVNWVRSLGRVRSEKSARKMVQGGGAIPSILASLLVPIIVEVGRSLLNKKNGS